MIIVLAMYFAFTGLASATTWNLVDDFSGSVVNNLKWDVTTVGSLSTVTIESGRLHLSSPYNSGGAGAFVTLKDTFSIDNSEDSGIFSLAYDVEMGANLSRSYNHYASVRTDSGDISRAEMMFYGGGDKDIYMDNGPTSGSAWLEKNFQNQPLHVQVTMSSSTISFKVFNFQSGNTPTDYTDTTASLTDTTPGSLIGTSSFTSGTTSTEELYLLLSGTLTSTSSGTGDIYFDNIYTSAPEPQAATSWYLKDNFSGSSVNNAKWNETTVGASSTVTIESGRLHLYSPGDATSGAAAFVTLKDIFSINDSKDAGILSLAYDAEMGASMSRPYGHYTDVKTVSGDTDRAHVMFYGGGDKDILLDNGSTTGLTWLEKNFQNQPLHVQVTMTTDTIDFKVFNFKSGNTPADYIDTSVDLNDTTAGSLIGTASLDSGISGNTEELYLLLGGTTLSTNMGTGDIYYDNVYTSIPVQGTLLIIQ
jgi:hypothetical protein